MASFFGRFKAFPDSIVGRGKGNESNIQKPRDTRRDQQMEFGRLIQKILLFYLQVGSYSP